MELGRLTRYRHRIAVTHRDIEIEMTLSTWSGTGNGVFYLRVLHIQNVPVTSTCVAEWIMATFPGRLIAEETHRRAGPRDRNCARGSQGTRPCSGGECLLSNATHPQPTSSPIVSETPPQIFVNLFYFY